MAEKGFKNPEMEVRTYTAELRADSASYGKKTPTIRGYSAKFNTLSEPMPIVDEEGRCLGSFREQLLPGCFASALPTSDVRALINHDPNLILGRTVAGTLRMKEDEVGLYFENDPPETSYAKDVQVSMQRGDISQCSFGFRVAKGGDSYAKDPNVKDGYIRSISQIEQLFDVSVVTYPAYVDTDCAVRSLIDGIIKEEQSALNIVTEAQNKEVELEAYYRNKNLELLELSSEGNFEKRVDMGYAGYKSLGSCSMCNQDNCMCPDCENKSWCNMHTKEDAGCCTKMLQPNCQCLGCPNTDKAKMANIYSW